MKALAIYNWHDGKPFTVEYDPNDPCILCGLPVTAASMGGTSVCPSCDCGRYRDGSRIDCMPGTETHKDRARRIHDLIIRENSEEAAKFSGRTDPKTFNDLKEVTWAVASP